MRIRWLSPGRQGFVLILVFSDGACNAAGCKSGTCHALDNEPRKSRSNTPGQDPYCLSFLCFTLSSSHCHYSSYIHSRTHRRIRNLPLHRILLISSLSYLSSRPCLSLLLPDELDFATTRLLIRRALAHVTPWQHRNLVHPTYLLSRPKARAQRPSLAQRVT